MNSYVDSSYPENVLRWAQEIAFTEDGDRRQFLAWHLLPLRLLLWRRYVPVWAMHLPRPQCQRLIERKALWAFFVLGQSEVLGDGHNCFAEGRKSRSGESALRLGVLIPYAYTLFVVKPLARAKGREALS